MGQKNGLHAFGYNSAESELIWMKSRTMRAKCWGLTLAYFWRDPRSSDSLRESRNLESVHFQFRILIDTEVTFAV